MSYKNLMGLCSLIFMLSAAVANASSDKEKNADRLASGADTEKNADQLASGADTEKNEDQLASASNTEKNADQLASVLAIDANAEFGAYLAGECLTCHTPAGANGNIPKIHGLDKPYLASAILEYRNKQRDNDVMRGVTAALSDEEVAAIATYLSGQ